MESDPVVIAVDGTAASGKGTLARMLARHFGFAHLDSGKLYRMVGLAVLDAGGNPDNESHVLNAAARIHRDLSDAAAMSSERLLSPEAGAAASRVAVIGALRARLLDVQRDFASKPPAPARGACIDGRDIGTVVCPDATAKLFVDAMPKVRAHRRWLELRACSGPEHVADESRILADITSRDERDRNRKVAPLKLAADAALLDTSRLDIDAAFAAALGLVKPKVEEALKARQRG